MMVGIAERLRAARIGAGYPTATKAAAAYGWPVGTYSCHENGARGVSPERAARYAAAFGVDAGWLLYGDGFAKYGGPGLDPSKVLMPATQPGPDVRPAEPLPYDLQAVTSLDTVVDRDIAEVLAVIADEYDSLNSHARQSWLTRFWAHFPELKERVRLGQGRRVARLAPG